MQAIFTTSRINVLALLVVASFNTSQELAASPTFLPGQSVGQLSTILIGEASGLATSRNNDDVFWIHNDSGDGPNVYAMNSTGVHLGTYRLTGASFSDWEDMAIGPDPVSGQSYLYLGDIGDNNARKSSIRIHRVAEPMVSSEQTPVDERLSGFETFILQYPDGPRDAETLMVDPLSGDIYIVSKRDSVPRIYRAPYPQTTSEIITMEFAGLLWWSVNTPQDWPTSGEISSDGLEVLIRSYADAKLWSVPEETSLADALAMPGYEVPLAVEPQGESIAFDANGQNYYTVSEGYVQPIYFYERAAESIAGDFDADDDVDGDDFLKWQRGESPDPFSQTDLIDWETNYGTIAPIAATSAAVPEPTAALLLVFASIIVSCGKRQRVDSRVPKIE